MAAPTPSPQLRLHRAHHALWQQVLHHTTPFLSRHPLPPIPTPLLPTPQIAALHLTHLRHLTAHTVTLLLRFELPFTHCRCCGPITPVLRRVNRFLQLLHYSGSSADADTHAAWERELNAHLRIQLRLAQDHPLYARAYALLGVLRGFVLGTGKEAARMLEPEWVRGVYGEADLARGLHDPFWWGLGLEAGEDGETAGDDGDFAQGVVEGWGGEVRNRESVGIVAALMGGWAERLPRYPLDGPGLEWEREAAFDRVSAAGGEQEW